MAERLNIPPYAGNDLASVQRWVRQASTALNAFMDQTAFNGAIYVWDNGCVTVPTNTTEAGAHELVFDSAFAGNGTILVTGVGFEGGVTASLNGVSLGTMSDPDLVNEIRYEFFVGNLIDGFNSFKIWSTTSDAGELRRLEVWRNHVKNAIDSATALAGTTATNFNARNDRIATAVTNPTIFADGTAVDHTINTDGSADISFEWAWAGTEADIDGFLIYERSSSSAAAYTFGTTPAQENVYQVPANKRAAFFFGVAANVYHTFGVQAYRTVDPDIDAAQILKSAVVQPSLGAENPYRPTASVAFAGDITGTINGTIAATDVNQWASITGTGKPDDNATRDETAIVDNFAAYATVAEVPVDIGGASGGEVALAATADKGGQALRLGNSAGNDYVLMSSTRRLPFDPDALYECAFDLEAEFASTGVIYLGVRCDNAAGVNLPSDVGSYHYFAAANIAAVAGQRVTFRGFFKGAAAVGAGNSVGTMMQSAATPRPVAAGTAWMRLVTLTSYPSATGQDLLHEWSLKKVSAVGQLQMASSVGVVVAGDLIYKTSGGSAWNGQAYSKERFAGSCFVSFQSGVTAKDLVLGLDADPTASAGYTSIDYAINAGGTGNATIFESGASVLAIGAYTTDTLFAIVFDGVDIIYFKDNVEVRRVAAPANYKPYIDSSFYHVGATAKNVRFGPGLTNTASKVGSVLAGDLTTAIGRLSTATGNALSNFIASDGRSFSKIAAVGEARDGDAVSFGAALPAIPNIVFLPGGNGPTAGQSVSIRADAVSTTAFNMVAKTQSVTPGAVITDTGATAGGGGEPDFIINRTNSGWPFDAKFVYRISVTVGDLAPGEPGTLTVTFWAKKSTVWTAVGGRLFASTGTYDTSIYPGSVDFGAGSEFGVSVGYAEGFGTVIGAFVSVKYTLGAVTETSLTPTGASSIPWLALLQ